MALNTDFNVSPYYDDYNEEKNFHRVLFRPAVPIQARELTQLQTILQSQVERFGDNIYRQGTIIKGCSLSFDFNYTYIKIEDLQVDGITTLVSDYANGYVENVLANTQHVPLKSEVVNYVQGLESQNPDLSTLFIKYINTGTGGKKKYANGDVLKVYDRNYSIQSINISAAGALYNNTDIINITGGSGTGASASLVTYANGSIRDVVINDGGSGYLTQPAVNITTSTGSSGSLTAQNFIAQIRVANSSFTDPVGTGAAVTVGDGIIYQRGHFVRVEEQTTIVSKYTNQPSNVALGFVTAESIVNNSVDSTLLDNAQGYSNYAAPGSHRLKLTPSLVAISVSNAASNSEFLSILEFQNGTITKRKTGTEFNSISSELAKRTREESGNYVVKPFLIYTEEKSGNTSHLNLSVSSGVGYVDGFRAEITGTIRVPVRKGTDTTTSTNQTISTNFGNYVVVTEVLGNFDFSTGSTVYLRDAAATDNTDNFGGDPSSPGSIVGSAKVKSFMYESGTPGTPSCRYRLYLFNIAMTPGKVFSSVRSVQVTGGVADVVLVEGRAELKETSYNSLIFSSGANAVSFLSNEQFIYRKVGSTSILGSGIASVSLTGSEEFPYTAASTLNDTQELDFIVIPTSNAHSTTNLTGTVSTSGNVVTGTSTNFIADLDVGDYVKFSGNNSYYRVSTISSATSLTIQGSTGPGVSSNTISYAFPKNIPIRLDRGTANVSIDSNGNTAYLFVGGTISGSTSATVYFNSKVDGANPKPKNAVKSVYVKLSTDKLSANTKGPWCIGVPDAYKLVGVYVGSSNTYSNTTTNYASSFELINGQTDNTYGLASIRKKPGSSLSLTATNNLLVRVDLYTHGSGYYLSTESYPVDDSTTPLPANKIRTEDIPYYLSSRDNKYFNLRDSIDFRPIVANTANAAATSVAGATIDPSSTETLSGTLYFPTPNESFQADITHYLRRVDTIVIDGYGSVSVVEGKPELNPVAPRATDSTMKLGNVVVPPYPSLSPKAATEAQRFEYSTLIKQDQTKGYTMQDIKQIEDRINRIEYYSLLNTLEKDATDLIIPSESNNQISRFKNGFFADSFSSYNISNVNDPEYSIYVDTSTSTARPQIEKTHIQLVANTAASSNVTIKGEYALIDYTESTFLNQPIANKTRNPTQLFWNFQGRVQLFPKYDDYYDIKKGSVNVTVDLATPINSLAQSINNNVTFKKDAKQITTTTSSYATVQSATTNNIGIDQRTISTTTTTTTNKFQPGDTTLNLQKVGEFVTDFGMKPYIRAQGLTFVAVGLRPNATHYVFFDKVNVSQYCRRAFVANIETMDSRGIPFEPSARFVGSTGDTLTTDANGTLIGVFYIPENTFFVGERSLFIADNDNIDTAEIAVSTAIASFNAYNFYKDSSSLTVTTKNPGPLTLVSNSTSSTMETTEQRIIPRLPPPPRPPAPVGCCFISGTKITMADGSVKSIEDVVIGDRLVGKDKSINTVLDFVRPMLGSRTLISFNGGVPFMTNDHPVYMKDGSWKSYDPEATKNKYVKLSSWDIGKLEVGDVIETNDGLGFKIQSMSENYGSPDLQVYNFSLDGNHTYVANGLVVHNKCFIAGTQVLLADGSSKDIAEIELGDVLLGHSGTHNEVVEDHSQPISTRERQPIWYGFNGNGGFVTAAHPILTEKGWRAVDVAEVKRLEILPNEDVQQLEIGDVMICKDGETVSVSSIEEYYTSPDDIGYNHGLTGDHTYFVKLPGTDKWLIAHNRDPLAQTFNVNNNDGSDGVFLTKVDLFFKAKDSSLGVTVQIRLTENGYPAPFVIGEKFLRNSSINTSNNGSAVTTVTFDTPIYLKAGSDYSVVVIPEQFSPEFLLWVGQTGVPDIANKTLISNQNWGAGVMFLSSNDTTWTPYQGEDIKFKIYIANFAKTSATLVLENAPYEFLSLSNNSGTFTPNEEVAQKSNTYLSGTFTCNTTSSVVNTTSSQTGTLSVGDYVLVVSANTLVSKTGTVTVGSTSITNVTGSGTNFVNEYNAGDYLIINGNVREVVSIANSTQLTLDAPLSASVSANAHSGVTERIQISRVNSVNTTSVTLKDTPLYQIDGGTTQYGAVQKVVRATVDVIDDNALTLKDSNAANSTFKFESGKRIVGEVSQATATIVTVDDRTVNFLESHMRYIAPPTTSVTQIQNINTLSGSGSNSVIMEGVSNSVKYEGEIQSRSNEITSGSKSLKVYVNFTRANTFNSVSPVVDTVPVSAVLLKNIINNDYTDETTTYGNSQVRYISKNVVLADGLDAEDMKVYITAYKPSTSNILIYAKILSSDDNTSFNNIDWTLLEQVTEANLYSDSLNENNFIEYEYGFKLTPPSSRLVGVITSSSNTTLTGSGSTFSSSLVANDVVKVVQSNTLTGYDIAVVDAVANNTSLTLKDNTSFSGIASIEKVTQPGAAFKYNRESNIVTYLDSSRGRHSTYKTYAIKIVLVSSSTKYVPILKDVRALAVSI
jgi:hypothetical protein